MKSDALLSYGVRTRPRLSSSDLDLSIGKREE
jgi:hypothetical protein